MQENLRKIVSGVPYPPRPIRADHGINTAQQSASDVDDASRLSWKRSDDVTVAGQSAAKADQDMLVDRYGRLSTGNLPVGTEPRSDEVQQLIEVLKKHHSSSCCRSSKKLDSRFSIHKDLSL